MNITSIKSKQLYIGGNRLLNVSQTKQAASQLGTTVELLGGLPFRSAKEIIKGGTMLDRPENSRIAVIGRGDDDDFNPIDDEPSRPIDTPALGSTLHPDHDKWKKHFNTKTSTPTPTPSPVYNTTTTYLLRPRRSIFDTDYNYSYSSLGYARTLRELDRALYQKKLRDLEEDYYDRPKRRSKSPSWVRKKRKSTKRKTRKKSTKRKKSKKRRKSRK